MVMVSKVIFHTFRSFLAIWGLFRPFLAILAPNLKLSQTSHVTTQNDRKRSRNPMEMVSDVTFLTFRPFLVIWGLFRSFWAIFGRFGPKFKIVADQSYDQSKRPQEEQNSYGDSCGSHFEPLRSFGAILGSFLGHFRTIPGQFVAPNSKLLQTSHVTTQNNRKRSRALIEMVPKVTLKTLRSFWAILGPFRDHFGPFLTLNSNLLQISHVITQNDCKWSRMQMMMVSRLNFKMFRSFWGLERH